MRSSDRRSSRWAILQHVPYEGAGLIASQAQERGFQIDTRRLYAGDTVPGVDDLRGLTVMGGPMGAGDTDAHPYLEDEVELLAAAVDAGVPILGVCLALSCLPARSAARSTAALDPRSVPAA